MTKPVPLCIDCAHHVVVKVVVKSPLDLSSIFGRGSLVHSCTREQIVVTNPVDGAISYRGRQCCWNMRLKGADCGPSGQFFKPKAGDRA